MIENELLVHQHVDQTSIFSSIKRCRKDRHKEGRRRNRKEINKKNFIYQPIPKCTTQSPLSCWERAVTSAAVPKAFPKINGEVKAQWEGRSTWTNCSQLARKILFAPSARARSSLEDKHGELASAHAQEATTEKWVEIKRIHLSPGQQAFVPSIQIISTTPTVQRVAIEMLLAYCIYRLLVPTGPLPWSLLRHPMPSVTSSLPLSANAAGALQLSPLYSHPFLQCHKLWKCKQRFGFMWLFMQKNQIGIVISLLLFHPSLTVKVDIPDVAVIGVLSHAC